jgi:phospholipase C
VLTVKRTGVSARNVFLVAIVGVILLVSSAATMQLQSNVHSPIQHVIVVMQENRTFDNYFWTYPGQIGYNASLCMPLNPSQPSRGCMKPTPAKSAVLSGDLPHSWTSSWTAYNDGLLNGFLSAAGDNPNVMTYYDSNTLPYLWALAGEYVLADQFFTSAKSYSQPNHWYMISGNAPTTSLYEGNTQEQNECYDAATHQLTMSTCSYINQAHEIQTMADLLTSRGITWKYYDTAIPKDATLVQAIEGKCKGCDAYAYWNPLEAKNSSYTDPQYTKNLVNRVQLFSDLGNGTLPQVSWVIPSSPLSDHPPANVTLGMLWVSDIVDSVMRSQYWGSTAIIVLWDDYGGFFDTVVPPVVDDAGLSFRCPALIISPYAKAGYLDHTVYDFESTLKFVEWIFGLPSLTSRDASANNLLNAFNFAQTRTRPGPIPITQSQLNALHPRILEDSLADPNPNLNVTALLSHFIDNNPD